MKMQILQKLSNALAPPAVALVVVLFGASFAHAALTPAGTTITNSATVDYEDAAGNDFSATSEDATVDVGSVYDATIEEDELTIVSAPATTENISFIVTNLSNASETFTVTYADDDGLETSSVVDPIVYNLFLDTNGNGLADGGEVSIASGGTFTLPGNTGGVNIANLVLQVQVPGSATNGQEIGSILTVTGANVATVTDLTPAKGDDGLDETVQSLITVSGDAVLNINKSAVIDAGANRITYTLSVTNNGSADAEDVRIVDFIPANTTFEAMQEINLSTAQGDRYWDGSAYQLVTVGTVGPFLYDDDASGSVVPADPVAIQQTITEPTNVDLNDDGTNGGTFTGIEFLRKTLSPASSVSVVYSVTYNPALAAGTNIVNTFCAQGDLDENDATGVAPVGATGAEAEVCSNTTTTPIPTVYGVDADDTDGDRTGGAPVTAGEFDTSGTGDDEDNVDNDTQYEHTAAAGEVVRFSNVITNTGNAADSFDLAVNADNTFPVGTTFSYFIGGSSIGSNTGSIAAGASVTITVRATLPGAITDGMATNGVPTVEFDAVEGVFFIDTNLDGSWDSDGVDDDIGTTADNENFLAVLTATSATDPSGTPASDTKEEALGAIRQGVVDLANTTITIDTAVNADAPADLADGIIDDGDATDDKALNQVAAGTDGGDAEDDIISTFVNAPGDTRIIPLFVANESGASTSYTVSVDTALTTIPLGWNVTFRPAGGGSTFVSTPTAVAPGTEYAFEAVVLIPSDVAQASAGDYDFAFKVVSNSNANVTDTKVDRISVSAVCNILEGAGATDQLGPNGTVFYSHQISNEGNEAQTLTFSNVLSIVSAGANGLTGWTANIEFDTTGDGSTDTDLALLDAGDDVYITDAGGSLVAFTLLAGEAITLLPGEAVAIRLRVFAPSTADFNDKIRATITVAGGCEVASIIDDTTVALNVRIDKEVAIDVDCDCDETGLTFAQDAAGTVLPGQCLLWQLTVTNDGTLPAENVVISDEITPFSVAMSSAVYGAANPSGVVDPGVAQEPVFQVCASENFIGGLCQTAGNIVDADAYDAGAGAANLASISGTSVTFNVGEDATAVSGGTLIGSDSAVAQFCVQVQ